MEGLFARKKVVGKLSLINHSHRPEVVLDPRKAPTIDEFIGRPSPLGNPYKLTKDVSRDEVCDQYDKWLRRKIKNEDEVVLKRLHKIADWIVNGHDVRLVCFCVPKRCHGESVIKQVNKILESRNDNEQGS